MIIYLLWALVLVGLAIILLLSMLIMQSERLAKVLEVQMKGLNETYMQGLEIVTMSLERLEKRVKEIEDEVL